MRITVTGGSGRIGREVCAALVAAGHRVLVVDRADAPPDGLPGVEYRTIEMADYGSVLEAVHAADVVIGLAGIPAPTGRPPAEVHANNVVASYNTLCAAAESGVRRVLMASSVNAIGLAWSRDPQFDYFPVDEHHATRNEDAYSLSKWIGEQQADSIVRLHPELSVGSFRIHAFLPNRQAALEYAAEDHGRRGRTSLWGYTTYRMLSDAVLRGCVAEFTGHQIFWVVAGRTASDTDSRELAREFYPRVPLRADMSGNQGFFDCSNTRDVLGWIERE